MDMSSGLLKKLCCHVTNLEGYDGKFLRCLILKYIYPTGCSTTLVTLATE